MDNIQVRFVTSNPFKRRSSGDSWSYWRPGRAHRDEDENFRQRTPTARERQSSKSIRQYSAPLFVEHTGLYLKYMNDLPGD